MPYMDEAGPRRVSLERQPEVPDLQLLSRQFDALETALVKVARDMAERMRALERRLAILEQAPARPAAGPYQTLEQAQRSFDDVGAAGTWTTRRQPLPGGAP